MVFKIHTVFTKFVCSYSLLYFRYFYSVVSVLYNKVLVKFFFAIYFFQFNCSSLGKKSTDKRGSMLKIHQFKLPDRSQIFHKCPRAINKW